MTDGMPRPRLPYLRHEKNRHGKWCWYFRKGDGPRIRMLGAYGSDEFKESYDAALAGTPKRRKGPESGTLSWLVDRYKESAKFASLKPSTRRLRDNILVSLKAKSGSQPYTKIERKHMQAAMDAKASTPHQANNTLVVVSQMFAWAVKAEYIKTNPCDGVEMFKVDSDGFHTWTTDEVEQYRERHKVGTKARLALDLLLFTGLRRSDLFRAGKQHVKDGLLTLRTQKTGTTVYLTIWPELRKSIEATATGDMAFLTSATGRPFASAQSFGNWFKARCREAGLSEDCAAHGVRKAGATIAANNGATARQLMAMYGWARIGMAERYTKEADKILLARAAAERIANSFPPHQEQGAAENPEMETKSTAEK